MPNVWNTPMVSSRRASPRCVSSAVCIAFHSIYDIVATRPKSRRAEGARPPALSAASALAQGSGVCPKTRQVETRPWFAYLLTALTGTGAYGSVLLVRVRPRQEGHQIDRPGSLFAIKVLQKTDIQNFDKVRTIDRGACQLRLNRCSVTQMIPMRRGKVSASFRGMLGLTALLARSTTRSTCTLCWNVFLRAYYTISYTAVDP